MSFDLSVARAVARLLYPSPPGGAGRQAGSVPRGEAPSGSADAETLVAACRANKVPLLALDARAPVCAAFYDSPAFHRARAEEEASWAAQRAEYLLVREALATRGLCDVLIKAAGIAPSLPYTSDNLDILVALADGPRARRVLLDLGYVELKNVEEPHKFLFRKFHRGVSISAIHLHEFVGWGTGFMLDEQVLARARPAPDDPALWIPAPEEALLITLAHAFYEDKAVKLGDLWKVMHLLRQEGLDWERVYAHARQRGWEDGLDTCISLWAGLEKLLYGEDSFPAEVRATALGRRPGYAQEYIDRRLAEGARFPFRVSFRFSKHLYYDKILLDQQLPAGQKVVDIARHSLAGIRRRLPFRSQRPMLVTLSGIDGSGKTVHLEALRQALRTCDISARVVWSRGGSSPLADGVIRLVKPWLIQGDPSMAGADKQEGGEVRARVARKRKWLRRPWLRRGWTALVVADLLARYWIRVMLPLWAGRVVLCDRYTYDALAELAALNGRPEMGGAFAARLLRALTPRPQRAYLLAVSPQEASRRKPEEPPDHLAAQAEVYHQWAARWGLLSLPTDTDLAESLDRLTREVLLAYYRDWRTVINGLFLANPQRNP